MNFENLYSRVFVKEADETDTLAPEVQGEEEVSTIPTPDNYGVEPMPVAKNTGNNIVELENYISKLQEFLNVLNGTSSDSLQRFVIKAEGPNSLLKGIANDTSDDIVSMAGKIAELVQTLQGFVSKADMRRRELAVAASQA